MPLGNFVTVPTFVSGVCFYSPVPGTLYSYPFSDKYIRTRIIFQVRSDPKVDALRQLEGAVFFLQGARHFSMVDALVYDTNSDGNDRSHGGTLMDETPPRTPVLSSANALHRWFLVSIRFDIPQVSAVPFLSLGIGIDDMFIFIYTLVSEWCSVHVVGERLAETCL